MKKLALLLLLLIALLSIPINSNADDSGGISLTLEECMDRAVVYSHKVVVLEQQMRDVKKQQKKAQEMSDDIQEYLDSMDSYKRLYERQKDGDTLTVYEKYELLRYQYTFGFTPQSYPLQEMYEKFIKNRDLPHYSAGASYQNLKTNGDVLSSSIKMTVKQLFDSIVDMQDAIFLQKQLYANMQKQNEIMLVKYNKGQVPEINKYLSDCELERQRLTIQKLNRSLDNMMISIKQQIGVTLQQELVLKYDNTEEIKETKSYNALLNDALSNRSEVLITKMNLQVKQREDDILKQYFLDGQTIERVDSLTALEEVRIAYDEAVNSVTSDIYSGYSDVKLKQHNLRIAKVRLQNAEQQYKETLLKYEKGLISLTELWNIEITKVQARFDCNKAIRDNNNMVYKLEVASGIGPGYSASGGY